MVIKKLIHIGLKNSRFHLLRSFLLISGIALGVAVIIAIDIANTGVTESFKLSGKIITGNTTHQIIGVNDLIDQDIYRELKTELGIKKCTPVITGFTEIKEFEYKEFQILGVDFFSMNDFRTYSGGSENNSDNTISFNNLMKPGNILISSNLAEEINAEKGQTLSLYFGEIEKKAILAGFLEDSESQGKDSHDGVIVCDIAVAQELLGLGNNISRIDLIIDTHNETIDKNIQEILPEGLVLISMDKKNASLRRMSRSFEVNIAAFSVLGLFMGVFLIFNTVSLSITQRKKQFGIMRALGVTGQEIFMMILGETALFAVIGGIIGIVSGVFLGGAALKVVTGTVSGLFFHLAATVSDVSLFSVLKGLCAGIITTLLAAVYPAVTASRIKPVYLFRRSVPELRMKRMIPVFSITGVIFLCAGTLFLIVLTESLVLNFFGIFLIFTGSSLLVPLLTRYGVGIVSCLIFKIHVPFFRLSLLNLNRSLSRMVVSISSLMIMVSVFVGIGLMTGSFRNSIINWSENSIRGDLMVSSSNSLVDRVPDELIRKLKKMEKVKDVKGITVVSNFSQMTGHFVIFASDERIPGKTWIYRTGMKLDTESQEDSIFVSEVFAFQNGIEGKEGESTVLDTKKGAVTFPVAGIFQDFFTGGGRIEMSQKTLKKYWNIDHISDIHVFAEPSVKPPDLLKEIQNKFGEDYSIRIRENAVIRKLIVEAFDNTFMITIALQLLAASVAVIGIFNSAMAVFSERDREFGTLRACGLTRFETGRLMITECGICGIIAGILSIPLGLALSWILIVMINKRSFGWSYDFILDPGILIQALLLSVFASVAAGFFPAFKSSNTNITSALSNE